MGGAYAMYTLSPCMVAASDACVRAAKRILALPPHQPPARRGSEISHGTRGAERQAVKHRWPTPPQPRTSQKSYGWQVLLDGSNTESIVQQKAIVGLASVGNGIADPAHPRATVCAGPSEGSRTQKRRQTCFQLQVTCLAGSGSRTQNGLSRGH